jgi:hypothetical protein
VGKRKRVSGEGTYKKRKDGRWEAQYTVYTASGTKRKSVYGRTTQEWSKSLGRLSPSGTVPLPSTRII